MNWSDSSSVIAGTFFRLVPGTPGNTGNQRGLASSCHFSWHMPRSWTPVACAVLAISAQLHGGFRIVKTSPTTSLLSFGAELLWEGTVLPAAYAILCVRFASLVPPPRTTFLQMMSARHATLDTGGWLGLAGRGLAPRKKRQASLAAPTSKLSGAAKPRPSEAPC